MVACAAGTSVAAAIQLLRECPQSSTISAMINCINQGNDDNNSRSRMVQPAILQGEAQQQTGLMGAVDQLKQQLQRCITAENNSEIEALDAISKLEKLQLTKEVLETTRIGAVVNELRKKSAQTWLEVSKRCRALIKLWQKVAVFHRPFSSCEGSSNGGTPNLVSPAAFRRGLTPRTPGGGIIGKRITSTDSQHSRTLEVSQNGGSYAPNKGKSISPFGNNSTGQMHKSISMAGGLGSLKCSPSSDEFSRDSLPNGADAASFAVTEKRKISTEESSNLFKRTKGGAKSGGNQTITTTPPVSVLAARKNVQSTVDLLAQLSENLPQSMAIDIIKPVQPPPLSQQNDGELLHREKTYPLGLDASVVSTSKVSPAQSDVGRPKRKYTKRAAKFFKNQSSTDLATISTTQNGFSEDGKHHLNGIAEEEDEDQIHYAPEEIGAINGRESSLEKEKKKESDELLDWYSAIPSMETLRERSAEYAKPRADPTASCVIPIRQRQVLLLPYVDIGLPDFVEYNFPQKEQFLAQPSWALQQHAKQQQ